MCGTINEDYNLALQATGLDERLRVGELVS
jgi:hypothetical protein